MLKDPQNRAVQIIINQQQLEQIVRGLQLLAEQNTIDDQFDNNDVFFVPVKTTLQMLEELATSTDPDDSSSNTVHGLCL